MDVRVTEEHIRMGQQIAELLRACDMERCGGTELMTRGLEAANRDLLAVMRGGKLQLRLAGRSYEVTHEVAMRAAEVGMLAEKWEREGAGNLLNPVAAMITEWATLLRSRRGFMLTPITEGDGAVVISWPGEPGRIENVQVALLALVSFKLADEQVRDRMTNGGSIKLVSV